MTRLLRDLSPRQRGVLAAALGMFLLAATCGEVRYQELSRGGFVIRQVQRNERATRRGGVVVAPGDFIATAPGLRVVIGGLTRGGDARGAILEALVPGMTADESLVLVAPRIYVGRRSFPIVPRNMFVAERHGRPVLRIEGEATVDGRSFDTVSDLSFGGVPTALYHRTRVMARDQRRSSYVRVGLRVGWGGPSPFVAGVGAVDDDTWHEAAWLGRAGENASSAIGAQKGPVSVRAEYERHGQSRFLLHTDVVFEKPRPSVAYSRTAVLAFAHGGLSQAVRRVGWARGRPFPEVVAMLPYRPSGATVRVRSAAGRPIVEGRPDGKGRVLLPLLTSPRADQPVYASATAWGHATSDEVRATRERQRLRLEIPRGGSVRVTAVDAAGAPMPVRFRVLPVGSQKRPEFGPEWQAKGAGDAVITMRGDAVVPLQPGRYRVLVSHGPEYTLVTETIEVTETYRPHVKAVLRHVVDPGEFVACDFHLHAAPSPDSEVSLEDRIASLVAEGVRFAVPTDHNHVTDYAPVVKDLAVEDFGTVPGVEVTTWDPAFGHFNAFPFRPDPTQRNNGAPPYLRTTPAKMFADMRKGGDRVLVQVNHPRLEGGIGYFDVLSLDPSTGSAAEGYSADFDLLEVWNGFDLARPEMVDRVFGDWLALLAHGQKVFATGNSDSHKVSYQWAGYPRTYVYVPGGIAAGPNALIESLHAGRAFVTSGPFLDVSVDGMRPGETVAARDGRVRVAVRVQAAPWIDVTDIEFYLGVEKVMSTKAVARGRAAGKRTKERPVVRFDGTVELEVREDTFLVVRVRGTETLDDFLGRGAVPPMAFSNPIFIDADGNGEVPWQHGSATTPAVLDGGIDAATPDASAR